jgi:hypothetical protein
MIRTRYKAEIDVAASQVGSWTRCSWKPWSCKRAAGTRMRSDSSPTSGTAT